MMKRVNLCMWVFLVAFVCMLFDGGIGRSLLISGEATADRTELINGLTSRKLEETGKVSSFEEGHSYGPVSLEDYRPFDPSPSSKAKVKPGPIQHGAPLMPYIPNPKPSPPSHPDHDGNGAPPGSTDRDGDEVPPTDSDNDGES